MGLVHWISFLLVVGGAAAILLVNAVFPSQTIGIPGLGEVGAAWVLGSALVLGFLSGWIYVPPYWRRMRRQTLKHQEEIRALNRQLEQIKARHPEEEEFLAIPDRKLEAGPER